MAAAQALQQPVRESASLLLHAPGQLRLSSPSAWTSETREGAEGVLRQIDKGPPQRGTPGSTAQGWLRILRTSSQSAARTKRKRIAPQETRPSSASSQNFGSRHDAPGSDRRARMLRGGFGPATGKTHTPGHRGSRQAIEGGVPIDRIAAVTFNSCRCRIDEGCGCARNWSAGKNQGEAIRSLDRAFIGTIHSFCAHLLRQRPVEGLRRSGLQRARRGQRPVALRWCISRNGWRQNSTSQAPVLRRALSRLAWSERAVRPRVRWRKLRDAAWRLAEWARPRCRVGDPRHRPPRGACSPLFERV